MKIQLSQQPIVKDHLTVWQNLTPGVDIAMDLKNLTFSKNSIESIVAIHVLDHFFENEVQTALKNWYDCLQPGGAITLVVDNFEYIARAFVGADISIEMFIQKHNHAMQFSQDSLSKYLEAAGFKATEMRVWYAPIPDFCPKEHYELLIAAKK